jgi:methyl-accepting chemotaxis protein
MGAAIAGLVLIAGLGMYQMGKVYDAANYGNINTVPSLIVLDQATSEFGRLRVRAYRHVLNTDSAKMAEIETKIKEAQDGMSKALGDYEKLLSDDKDRSLLEADKSAVRDYLTGLEATLNLSRNNQNEQAREMLSKYAATAEKLNDALHEHMQYNTELGKKGADEAQSTFSSSTKVSIVLAVIVIAIILLTGIMIIRNLLRQLGGEPAYAAEVVGKIANGDLTTDVQIKAGDTTSMLAAIKGMSVRLSEIIGGVRGSAEALASASEEVSATAQSMSQATSEQAASVEETSASVEQMSASIEQNTENAKVTDSMASQAARQATEGGAAVNQTVEAMKSIADKIGIIDDIAYQTNLLALNAAIEAARAGEHGKGFAVVAAEVRKLAERSQVAAQEIGEVAKGSVGLAEKAGKLLDEIVPGINKTSDLVQEITAASTEQSAGVSQINTAMIQLNQITQQNASASEELAATAEEMSGQAVQLQEQISFFKVSDGVARGTVRAHVAPTVAKRPANKTVPVSSGASPAESGFVPF